MTTLVVGQVAKSAVELHFDGRGERWEGYRARPGVLPSLEACGVSQIQLWPRGLYSVAAGNSCLHVKMVGEAQQEEAGVS